MKVKSFKKVLSTALIIMLAFGAIAVGTVKASADSKWIAEVYTLDGKTVYTGQEVGTGVYDQYGDEQITLVSVKSSKPGVLKVKKSSYGNEVWFNVTGKKAGKSTLTYKYKTSDGKEKTLTKAITVKTYPKQIRSLKVNGKKVKIKGENKFWYGVKNKKTNAKINLKLKKGWKISNVYGNYYNSKTNKDGNIKDVKKLVKKGKTIKFPKKWDNMYITVEMKKGKSVITYDISFWR